MRFSPASSTRMRATPVASSGDGDKTGGRHARLDQRGPRLLTEPVAADRADERRRRPEARCGDRLVSPLAAVMSLEDAAGRRLAGRRQAHAADDEVDVDRPDDEDAAAHRAGA